MIVLRADNRELIKNAKYSYLLTNNPSNVGTSTAITLVNSVYFEPNDFILIGDFGSETTEVFKVDTVNHSTHEITLMDRLGIPATTKFAHAESTRITILPYDQMRFFHTSVPTYIPPAHTPVYPVEPLIDTLHPLTAYIDIEPNRWESIVYDETYSTGWGFFIWYNSHTTFGSKPSNPIPYVGFGYDTAQSVIESFYDGLNNKETAVVTKEQAFRWLNEGYAIMRNKLNLSNSEYAASLEVPITIYAGEPEARLPGDFSDLISVRPANPLPLNNVKNTLDPISLRDIPDYNTFRANEIRYFLRESYIGLYPTVQNDTTIYIRYTRKSDKLNSYDDIIYLPDNGYIALQNYMLFKSSLKFKDGNATGYKALFDDWCKDLILFAHDRDNTPDSWGIANNANR
jgi:hypothetical protein